MKDADCIAFLQAVLPRLGMRWVGFRRVRKLVCKRVSRRLGELGVRDIHAYRARLEDNPAEWHALDALCRIPASRFYRDGRVFERLEHDVLPTLAENATRRGSRELACWSACCASGEEPYTLAILWRCRLRHRYPRLRLRVVATDIDQHLLERARNGCYGASSLTALPRDLFAAAFAPSGTQFCIRDEFRLIDFVQQDIRQAVPEGEFDLVLCRNAVLTYFAQALQYSVIKRVVARLRLGGALVVGVHESLPEDPTGLAPWPGARATYRKFEPGIVAS